MDKETGFSQEQKRNLQRNYKEFLANGISIYDLEYNWSQKGIVVNAFIDAPKKGDEALKLLGENLQKMANEQKLNFIHEGIPINKASSKMFERTKGYKKQGEGEETKWVKEFHPE